jgi:hypothetical protein
MCWFHGREGNRVVQAFEGVGYVGVARLQLLTRRCSVLGDCFSWWRWREARRWRRLEVEENGKWAKLGRNAGPNCFMGRKDGWAGAIE